jgi:hypothetical protein
MDYLKSSGELRFLKNFQTSNEMDVKKKKIILGSCEQKAEEFREGSEQRCLINEAITSELQKEMTMNEELKTKATELDHGNGVLKMENDIMGERLKGLYEAIAWVSSAKYLEDTFTTEITHLAVKVGDVDNYISMVSRDIGLLMRT